MARESVSPNTMTTAVDAPGHGHMAKILGKISSMWEYHMSLLKTTQTSLYGACSLKYKVF